MNERIRELAVEAGYTPLQGFDFANDLQEVFLKKFAELIVRECAWAADFAEDTSPGEYVKKHFGVE